MSVVGWSKMMTGRVSRGYKLATLRTLLDRAGLLTQVAPVGDPGARSGLVPSLAGEGPGVACG